MDTTSPSLLADLLTALHWQANLTVLASLLGAMLLGFVAGYERSYHGRAAGMRTYGLVCMASAALTVITGHTELWMLHAASSALDPTRVIQGVITGVGFLCAGVIMKDGMNISGLTTSASLWSAASIGVMMGIGMYVGAVMVTLLSLFCMMWVSRLEGQLPSRPAIAVVLTFVKNYMPQEKSLRREASERGYDVAGGSFSVQSADGIVEWRFVAVARGRRTGATLTQLSADLGQFEGIAKFHLSHARN